MSGNSDETGRSRGWCFTINNYTEDDEYLMYDWCQCGECTYCVVGDEIGEEEETPHLQGYIYFPTLKSFKQMKELHGTAHWEKQKGTIDEASDYCKKEGKFIEGGVKPMSDKQKGDEGKQSIAERWALAKEGRFEELPPEQIKTYMFIHAMSHEVHDLDGEFENLWIVGPSGCGKSRWVRDNHAGFYTKPMSKWWDGYQHEETVLVDDLDPEHGKWIGYYLKIWADRYKFNAEVKGGMLQARPKRIIVTSQYTIRECFTDPKTVEALERRFRPVGINRDLDHEGGGVILGPPPQDQPFVAGFVHPMEVDMLWN
nr:MAG: replication associated protein [Cressdnaviricota sp.]